MNNLSLSFFGGKNTLTLLLLNFLSINDRAPIKNSRRAIFTRRQSTFFFLRALVYFIFVFLFNKRVRACEAIS